MRTFAVLQAQARTRPEESFYLGDIGGATPADLAVAACKSVAGVEGVVLAISADSNIAPFEALARRHGVHLFIGPGHPIERLAAAARQYGFDTALRCALNSPFIDVALAGRLLAAHGRLAAAVTRAKGYPAGIVPEAITVPRLGRDPREAAVAYSTVVAAEGIAAPRDFGRISLRTDSPVSLALAKSLRESVPEGSLDRLIGGMGDILASLRDGAAGAAGRREANARLAAWEYSFTTEMVRAAPAVVRLEPEILCNIRCATCMHHFNDLDDLRFEQLFASVPAQNLKRYGVFRREEGGRWRRRSSPLLPEVFEAVRRDLFPFAHAVAFGYYGEALLNPATPDYVRQATESGLASSLTTNGMLLHGGAARALVEGGLGLLTVSFDGARPETFEAIRCGASFERVVKNIKDVAALRRGKGAGPVIQLAFTASGRNIDELPALVSQAAGWGVAEIFVMVCFTAGFMDPADSIFHIRERVRAAVAAARQRACEEGVALKLSDEMGAFVTGCAEIGPCPAPWNWLSLSEKGEVFMCGCRYVESAGNILDTPLMEILNSPPFRRFRLGLRGDAPMHQACRHCRGGVSEPPNPATFFAEPPAAPTGPCGT